MTSDVSDVILRDGATLRLRAPRREDEQELVEFFGALSERSLYLRFHGFPSLGPELVQQLLEPDWVERGALLGTFAEDGREVVVAVGNYERLRDPAAAEAAFAVADPYQRRGIGTRLVEQLALRAGREGIDRFVAEVLADNRDMLGVFEGLGFELTRELAGGEIEIQFPIARTERFEERLDERDHVAVTASLRPFFEPASVAVVGASRRRGSIGGELFRNVLEADFAGTAYPVNRDGSSVAGVRGYRSVSEIPDDVDLAVISVPAGAVIEAAEDALRKGVRALVVISAGFAEVETNVSIDHSEINITLPGGTFVRLVGDPKGAGAFFDASRFQTTVGPQLCLTWDELVTAIETSYVRGNYGVDFVCHSVTERVLRALDVGTAAYSHQYRTYAAARWVWGPALPSFNSQNPADWSVSRACPQ